MAEQKLSEILGYEPTKKRRKSDHYRSGFSRLWLSYYINESNRKTFFNAKQSAIASGTEENKAQAVGLYHKRMWGPVINEWMDEIGLSDAELKIKLHKLINAKETKIIKVKGAVNPEHLEEGTKVITTTGVIVRPENNEEYYSDGESVLAIEVESLTIQTKNLETAVKIKQMIKPPEIHVSGLENLAEDLIAAKERVIGGDKTADYSNLFGEDN